MNAIQQHIDNMFHDLPETKEIKRIKNDLYLNAMDRYDELLATGKTESEALGTIIIEMGEREVLLDDFDYDQEQDLMEYSYNSLEEAKTFIAANRQESGKFALGVFLILFASGAIVTLSTFGIEIIGVLFLLVSVASAVGLFIMAGFRLEAVENRFINRDEIFYLNDDDYYKVEDEYQIFQDRERYRIPVGVMLMILAVTPIVGLSFFENDFLIERFGVIAMTSIIGIAVSQFIRYGMVNTAFEKVLNIGDYTVEEQQFQRRIEPIEGIYWASAGLIYLAWSFFTMDWGITWIVWPIAGILWGIISMILKAFQKK